nr:hypothetical protein CFP56_61433 [Quercus suber]
MVLIQLRRKIRNFKASIVFILAHFRNNTRFVGEKSPTLRIGHRTLFEDYCVFEEKELVEMESIWKKNIWK